MHKVLNCDECNPSSAQSARWCERGGPRSGGYLGSNECRLRTKSFAECSFDSISGGVKRTDASERPSATLHQSSPAGFSGADECLRGGPRASFSPHAFMHFCLRTTPFFSTYVTFTHVKHVIQNQSQLRAPKRLHGSQTPRSGSFRQTACRAFFNGDCTQSASFYGVLDPRKAKFRP